MKLFIPYILLAITFFLTDLLTYKFIRKIDKKERKKLDREEQGHVNLMIGKYEELKNIEAYKIEHEKEEKK